MLIRPFFTQYNGGPVEQHIPSIDDPVPTITSYAQKYALIQPFLTRYNGGENRNSSACQPMPVIDTANRYAVVSPLFVPQHECGTVKPTNHPLPTIATSGAIGLVTPVVMDMSHPGDASDAARCHGSDPMGTITCRNNWGVAMPFMTEYYRNGKPVAVDQPIPTISTKDRFGVVQGRILTLPDGRRYQLDITHRMLTTRELADATGFSHDYVFSGTDTDAKKQIGNAVPPPLACALYLAALSA